MALFSLRDVLFLCFCGFIHFFYRYRRKSLVPLPPTLPGWPIIGNALQIPLTYPHIFYKKLGERLGSKIVYLEALGRPIIVINDFKIAKDLLEKRSGLYSSRPTMPMLTEVIKADHLFGAMPYGERWRNHRRIFQQHFSPKMLHREQDKALEFVRKVLLPNLYRDPEQTSHVRSCIGGFSLAITYGLPVQRINDPLVDMTEKYFAALMGAAAPGKYFVNIIPALKHVPLWVPGATFKKAAEQIRQQMFNIIELPYQGALKLTDDGNIQGTFVSENLNKYQGQADPTAREEDIKHIASQIFGAAAETTGTATMSLILALLTHPKVQLKAQREVDSVVGPDRLPDFSDQAHLPYLAAVITEVLRWNPIGPLGLPHMTTGEDVYGGYYIPKGCIVFANTYAMLHDANMFPNPTEFDPERFLQENGPPTDVLDPTTDATFGFGRRICPGSHIAMSALYIIAASILALFDISPALDAEGKPIEVTPAFVSDSVASEPLPFKCKFVPRPGKDIESLLQEYLGFDVVE